jgi:hypothetical protein
MGSLMLVMYLNELTDILQYKTRVTLFTNNVKIYSKTINSVDLQNCSLLLTL